MYPIFISFDNEDNNYTLANYEYHYYKYVKKDHSNHACAS